MSKIDFAELQDAAERAGLLAEFQAWRKIMNFPAADDLSREPIEISEEVEQRGIGTFWTLRTVGKEQRLMPRGSADAARSLGVREGRRSKEI